MTKLQRTNLFIKIGLTATILVLSSTALVSAQSGEIRACKNNSSGNLKIITVTEQCSPSETLLTWNQAGTVGPIGPQGPAGPKGDMGEPGPAGAKGDTGELGPVGATGLQGPAGAKGDTGEPGPTGATGPQGPAGAKGDTGEPGPAGATGPQGPAGAKGDTGEPGPAGATGPQGPTGAKGDTGEPGTTGATGPQGPAGPKGDTGEPGPAGATGPQGPAGAKGDTGEPGPAGATGPQGPAGPVGPQGPAGTGGGTFIVFMDGHNEEKVIIQQGPLTVYARCLLNGVTSEVELNYISTVANSRIGDDSVMPINTPVRIFAYGPFDAPHYRSSGPTGPRFTILSPTGDYIGLEPDVLGFGVNVAGHRCMMVGSAIAYSGQ